MRTLTNHCADLAVYRPPLAITGRGPDLSQRPIGYVRETLGAFGWRWPRGRRLLAQYMFDDGDILQKWFFTCGGAIGWLLRCDRTFQGSRGIKPSEPWPRPAA